MGSNATRVITNICDQCGHTEKREGAGSIDGWILFYEQNDDELAFCSWECVADFAKVRSLNGCPSRRLDANR
jgi:hypothetical protein